MRWRWANRRWRRSYSTARLTWPETQRRTTAKPIRTTTIATTSHSSGASEALSPPRTTSSITRPVRYGKVTEHAISPAALTAVTTTRPVWGRRKCSRRRRTRKVIHW